MISTQCEKIAKTQYLVLDKAYRTVSTNVEEVLRYIGHQDQNGGLKNRHKRRKRLKK